MGIQQICNTIKNYFKEIRKEHPELPGILIVCSMTKRPGLSTIRSTANIVNELSRLGIPTGVMPDGSLNLTVAVTYANVKEFFRAFRKDSYIQGALQQGSLIMNNGLQNANTGKIMVSLN